MKKITFILAILFIFLIQSAEAQNLSTTRMKRTAAQILYLFKSGKTENLHNFISERWISRNRISDIKAYKINSYTPEYYDIYAVSGNIVVAEIGSNNKSWVHILVLRFTEEEGQYKLIPG